MRKVFLVTVSVVAAVAGLVGRGSFIHVIVALAAVFYVGLPLAAIGGVLFLLRRRVSTPSWLPRVSNVVVGSILGLALSWPVGMFLLETDIHSAKVYCGRLIGKIEEFRAKRGRYPQSLTEVQPLEKLPRLLRERSFYGSDGQSYSFSFVDPSGMMNGFEFNSKTRRWEKWD